ncbi:MAG: molybdopterin-dependent oxidoreductase [Nocardia sp.]|nr:molybdopterin-dependent oxidoreductase [Nocardia sp.]
MCGLVATVQDNTVLALRPDPNHPLTGGFACPKGIAMTEVQADSDRIVHPLRRKGDGSFERVGWQQALAEIGQRLRAIRDESGTDAIGTYMGNPTAFSHATVPWVKGMMDALGSRHYYTASSQDGNSRLLASAITFGSPLTIPVPDLLRTDYLLMIGANPVVSHGSMFTGVVAREALTDIVDRGGRVVVVDPRRTETARLFEHLSIRPGGDAWFMLSMLNVIFADGLEDAAALARHAADADRLRSIVSAFTPERTEPHSGVPAQLTRQTARDCATARSAAFYGRVGACTGPYGTLVNMLLDALSVVTGNLDRVGGSVFPTPPIDLFGPIIKRGLDTVADWRTRVGDLPEVLGTAPAGIMAEEIRTPGPGRLRALLVVSGNPVLSVPGSTQLEEALPELDLLVSIDLGFNDTNRHADFILPATTFLEREDIVVTFLSYQLRPFLQWTDPVVAPRGEAREEWTILRDLSAELGIVPSSIPEIRRLGALARRIRPKTLFDAMLRMGPFGDRFGLRRGGLSIAKLRRSPHGVRLGDYVETGVIGDRLTHPDRLIHIGSDELAAEVQRLQAERTDPDYPMRLFGRRELRSINSWMKNSPTLMVGDIHPSCGIHPRDARALRLVDGGRARITSRAGSLDVVVDVTRDVAPGSVCMPHGWGKRLGRDGADQGAARPNVNVLTSARAQDLEQISGMSVLTGVEVRIEAVPPQAAARQPVIRPTH